MRLSLPLIVSSAVLVASAQRVNRSQCRASASSTIASPTSSTPASSSAPASTSSSSPSSSGSPATPNNLASTSTSGALSALLYTSVGSSGSYNMVTQMFPGAYPACSVSPACTYAPRQVSGNLAPFDEPLTVLFRGPMALDNVNVYQPGADGSWGLVSKFAAGQAPQNMVFMNNMGGKASGEWSCAFWVEGKTRVVLMRACRLPGRVAVVRQRRLHQRGQLAQRRDLLGHDPFRA